MKKILLILILLVFISACDNVEKELPGTKTINESFDIIDKTIDEVKKETKELKEISNNELPERNFTLEELQNFLLNGTYIESFEVIDTKENQKLIASSDLQKSWIIHIIDNTEDYLQKSNDFYNFVKSPEWQIWKTYIDEEILDWLYEILNEEEVNKMFPQYRYTWLEDADLFEYTYRDYIEETEFINFDTFEKPINISYGMVLQYRFEIPYFNQFHYWQEHWEDSLLIYKIPCTKDIVVYYRPKWVYTVTPYGIKEIYTNKTLENEVKSKKKKNINAIEKVMQFCGVNKKMFEGMDLVPYENHEKLAHNLHIYYKFLFDYSFDVDYSIYKEPEATEYSLIMNLTFIKLDKREIESYKDYVGVKIFMYDEIGSVVLGSELGGLEQNKEYSKNKKIEKIKITDKDIIVNPYIKSQKKLFKLSKSLPYAERIKKKNENFDSYYVGSPVVIKVNQP